MIGRSSAKYILVAGVGIGLVSCAAFGTKVRVLEPETIPTIKTVAIWPVAEIPYTGDIDDKSPDFVLQGLQNDPLFYAEMVDLCQDVERNLHFELSGTKLFAVIPADRVIALIRQRNPTYDRFPKAYVGDYRDLIDADAIVVTDLTFKGEGGGFNTYAVLSLYDNRGGDKACEVKFNTQWGKSYLFAKNGRVTMPDAIHGAVNGLAKAFRKHRPAARSGESN